MRKLSISGRPHLRSNIKTIFYPGMSSSHWQSTKYAGPEGVETSFTLNNNSVSFKSYVPNAPRLLHNIIKYEEISEVKYGWNSNPLYWPFYIKSIILRYYYNIFGACNYHIDYSNISIAGHHAQKQLENRIDMAIEKYPNDKIVIFGTSRGASTILRTVSELPKEKYDKISLVIFDLKIEDL